MILAAVVIGYILGAMPFVLPKILERREEKINADKEIKENKEQNEIFNEWLNGPSNKNQVNQEDIYEEYMTGKAKGD